MAAGSYPTQPSRPIGVAILAILVVLIGVLLLIIGIAAFAFTLVLLPAAPLPPLLPVLAGALGVIFLIFGLIWIGVGLGLWHLRRWAWWLAVIVMFLSVIGFLASPASVILPLIILIYLVLVRQHFR